jgi:hypothetical protein
MGNALCLGVYGIGLSKVVVEYTGVAVIVVRVHVHFCLIHPGSHSVLGFVLAPVSSRKRSSAVTHFGWLKSFGRFRRQPLAERCLWRAAAMKGN